MTGHQYRISMLVAQMSLGEETSGSVAKCRLFSQANSLGQGDVFKHELWSERFRLLGKFYCANSYHIDDINCSDKKNKTLPNLSTEILAAKLESNLSTRSSLFLSRGTAN